MYIFALKSCFLFVSYIFPIQKECKKLVESQLVLTSVDLKLFQFVHVCGIWIPNRAEMITWTESQIDTALYKLWFRSSTQLWHTKKLFYYEKSFPKKLFAVHVPSETRKWQPFISHFFVSLNNFYSSPTIIYKLGT